MKTLYDLNEVLYVPFKVTSIKITESGTDYYIDGGMYLTQTVISEKNLAHLERASVKEATYINWIDCKDREPNKNGDYLVTVEDDYGNMGGVIRTVEVSTYYTTGTCYTTDGDGETYIGWQTSSRVIAWADIPLEAYDGDYK